MPHRTPRNPSASQYQFSVNPSISLPRCSIVRPFSHKTTIDAGYLYPLYVEEVLPGDTFNVNASVIARLTTPIVPFMDNLYLDMHFFFVPYRIIWDNWERMHGAQDSPGDSIDYTVPTLASSSTGFAVGSLHDYFGLPTGIKTGVSSGGTTYKINISALPFRAYNLIWNEWYRDENLQQSLTVPKTDGPDLNSYYALRRRNKRKDYFTSALPWPQKGDTVMMNLAGTAPVVGNGMSIGLHLGHTTGTEYPGYGLYKQGTGVNALSVHSGYYGQPDTTQLSTSSPGGSSAYSGVSLTADGTKSGIVADLSGISAVSINELRSAFQIQKLLERNARGGTRYTELLQAHFGVSNPDSRLQRPELLGTFSIPISVNTVPQTSATESGSSPQGNLSAFAIGTGLNHCFDKSFTEFGIVLGLCSIRSDLTYQQGLERFWSRRGRFDFYYPEFAHLGEQAILNSEIYLQDADTVDSYGKIVNDKAFGYQERWSEYKYSVSRITGQLRSTYAQTLDYWHLAQKFDSLPTLGSTFIQENPPVSRILAVSDAPQFVVDAYFKQNCVRPMPLYCTPGLIDHF